LASGFRVAIKAANSYRTSPTFAAADDGSA
jgi:hypothetical protein